MVDLRFSKTQAAAALRAAIDNDIPLDAEIGEPDLLFGECRVRHIVRALSQRIEQANIEWPASDREASKILLEALTEGRIRGAYVDKYSVEQRRIPVLPNRWPEDDDGGWQYGPINFSNAGTAQNSAPLHVVVELQSAQDWLTSLAPSAPGAPRKRDHATAVFREIFPNGRPDGVPWKVALKAVNEKLEELGWPAISERLLQEIAKVKPE